MLYCRIVQFYKWKTTWASMVFTIYTIYRYLSFAHLCRHLGKWHLQAIATTGARFPDLDIIEIDSLLFVFVADIYELRYTNIYFISHIGRHLWMLHFQAIATTRDRFPDLNTIEMDFLFVFVAYLWATTYKYLFWRLKWPPSWKIAFASYCHYRDRFADLEITQIDSCEILSLLNFLC